MKKIICCILVFLFLITGCVPSVDREKNTGLKEYLVYDENGKFTHNFSPLSFQTTPFTEQEIEQFSILDNLYPYYRLDGRSMAYEDTAKDYWQLYVNDQLSYTQKQYQTDNSDMVFPYDIQPYYNDNTISSNILCQYLGDVQENVLPVYATDVLMNNLNLSYENNFNHSYIIDYYINCPIYNEEKQNKFDYKLINLKVQIIGVVKASDGFATAYLKYDHLIELIKDNNGEHDVPTDTYLLITDNKIDLDKVKNLEINRSMIIESREW